MITVICAFKVNKTFEQKICKRIKFIGFGAKNVPLSQDTGCELQLD